MSDFKRNKKSSSFPKEKKSSVETTLKEDEANFLLSQYQQLKSDVRNYDNLLWHLPIISMGFFAIFAGITDFNKFTIDVLAIILSAFSFLSFTIWYFIGRQETYRQFTLEKANEIERLFGTNIAGYPMPNEMSQSVTHWWMRASSVSVVKLLFFTIFLISLIGSILYIIKLSNISILCFIILGYSIFWGSYIVMILSSTLSSKR